MGSSSLRYDGSGGGGKEVVEIWRMLGAGELSRERYTFLVRLFHRSAYKTGPYRTDALVCPSTEALGSASGDVHGELTGWSAPRWLSSAVPASRSPDAGSFWPELERASFPSVDGEVRSRPHGFCEVCHR